MVSVADEIEVTDLTVDKDLELQGQGNLSSEELLEEQAADREALAKYVGELVALHADRIIAEFAQRLSDLELLVGQPEGAVQFMQGTSPEFPAPTYVAHEEDDSDVPWYG